jgi:putative phosphoesterase
MLIGLVSDTHVLDDLVGMPPEITDAFSARRVGLILHMGDVYSTRVLDVLEAVAPVVAVRDFTERASSDPRLAVTTRVVDVAGKSIGVVHDIGWPGPRIVADRTLELPAEPPLPEVLERKFGRSVDIVAFGHTHEELIAVREGVWFVNPGSPTRPGLRHRTGDLGTIGILEISGDGEVRAEIVKLHRRASGE